MKVAPVAPPARPPARPPALRPTIIGNDGSLPAIRVRASSWGSLFDCAYKWEGIHLLGLPSVSGLRAQLGTAIHAGTALFDESRLPGNDPVEIDDAIGEFVHVLRNPDREVDYSKDKLTLAEAQAIGCELVRAYCADIAPRYQYLAVEAKLKPMRVESGGVVIELTGSMDRARVSAAAGGVCIPDIKSGSRVIANGSVSIQGRSAQLGTYQLMWENDTGVPTVGGQIIALPTSGRPVPMVSRIWDAKARMLGTADSPGFIEIAAAMFSSGLFPPNPQSPMCSERYCPRWGSCLYRE